MPYYKAVRNQVIDDTGKVIATILPVNCTKKMAHAMAQGAVERANHAARVKEREQQQEKAMRYYAEIELATK